MAPTTRTQAVSVDQLLRREARTSTVHPEQIARPASRPVERRPSKPAGRPSSAESGRRMVRGLAAGALLVVGSFAGAVALEQVGPAADRAEAGPVPTTVDRGAPQLPGGPSPKAGAPAVVAPADGQDQSADSRTTPAARGPQGAAGATAHTKVATPKQAQSSTGSTQTQQPTQKPAAQQPAPQQPAPQQPAPQQPAPQQPQNPGGGGLLDPVTDIVDDTLGGIGLLQQPAMTMINDPLGDLLGR